jgi:hypothetical protein
MLWLAGAASGATGAPAPIPPGAFSLYDANADGVLDGAEYDALRRAMLSRDCHRRRRCPQVLDFHQIDTDGDGRITQAEMLAALEHRLKAHRRCRGDCPGSPAGGSP